MNSRMTDGAAAARGPGSGALLLAAALALAACGDFRSTAQADKGPPQEFGKTPIYGDPSAPSDFRDTSQTEGGGDSY